ncbi:MAG: RNAseH domain-containing protein [Symploca sp. SIO1B1]|nr:RNAseH domain-containing protein [Symploca sp. SIO1B1]
MSQYYIQLANKKVKSVPLAFTVPDDLEPVKITGLTIAWTKSALREFGEIQKATRSEGRSQIKELPYASLRGLLQVGLENAVRIEPHVGLQRRHLHTRSDRTPQPFTYLTDTNENTVKKALRSIWNNWITNYLRPFATREHVPENLLEHLEDLQEEGQLLTISLFQSEVLPWSWNQETGTTKPQDIYAYSRLVDYIARLIAGHEILAGLGPMKRLISSYGGIASGKAELITDPIYLSNLVKLEVPQFCALALLRGAKTLAISLFWLMFCPEWDAPGKFSLVVTIEIVTFPSLHQPLLTIDVSKRRWINQLNDPGFDRSKINGLVFCEDYQDRAFSYRVICQKDDQEKYCWKTDKDFEALRNKLELPMQHFDGPEISLGRANTESCKCTLTYRNGLGKHQIDVGVPEIDKLEAFEAIAQKFKSVGIIPFEAYKLVKKKSKGDNKEASREINLPTLLGAVLETTQTNCTKFASNYLKQFDDIELGAALKQNFDFSLEEIQGKRKALSFNTKTRSQVNELKTLIQKNNQALKRIYPNERLSLIIFYDEQAQTEVMLLTKTAELLWGESIKIFPNRLPTDTHGPKEVLPGNKLPEKERSQLRIDRWKQITQKLKGKNKTFCLVMARKWYQIGTNKVQHDDRINKLSTRKALAMANCCVQFIEPMNRNRSNDIDLEDFSRRVQKSLHDLISAHSGRIDDVKKKVDSCLQDIPLAARPKEIIGITIVRKQKGRSRKGIESTFLPIALRLNVETDRCEMCYAYERGHELNISNWSFFPDAIALISQNPPLKLASKRDVQQTRFMKFVKKIISDSVEEGKQPLVIIDSSNCVQLWPWLADIRINTNQISLGQQYQNMEQEWKGARIIRVRQELAPGIIDKKERQLFKTDKDDTRSKELLKKLSPDLRIPSASSSTGLFKITETNTTGCVAYLSVGGKTLHKNLRGQSCYHSTTINTSAKVKNVAGLEMSQLKEKQPFTDQWPTPNPLEIVVTLRQPEDNPDHLAALVESLRYGFGHYGEATALPAPLFFERVVRDYISEFAIEEDNSDSED